MKTSSLFTALASVAGTLAADQSICDKYTTALLKDNTAANQQTLLTLVVNTAVIGNYTQPNVGIAVPGILAPGMMNGEKVNLLPYFNGALASSNRGGMCGVSVNFLDDGGAAPLMMNMPSNTMTSNQYKLLTHLYEYFAGLLGCSMYGKTVSPYDGFTSMYQVHKFMALDNAEVGYFIQQVGLSAASFGVSDADVKAVGGALMSAFGYRCEPAASIPPSAPAQLQSICTDCDCPLSPMADCTGYGPVIKPVSADKASTTCKGYSCDKKHGGGHGWGHGGWGWGWGGHGGGHGWGGWGGGGHGGWGGGHGW